MLMVKRLLNEIVSFDGQAILDTYEKYCIRSVVKNILKRTKW